jgi:hypothetical protein
MEAIYIFAAKNAGINILPVKQNQINAKLKMTCKPAKKQ